MDVGACDTAQLSIDFHVRKFSQTPTRFSQCEKRQRQAWIFLFVAICRALQIGRDKFKPVMTIF